MSSPKHSLSLTTPFLADIFSMIDVSVPREHSGANRSTIYADLLAALKIGKVPYCA